jgi:hypothetical protein
MQYHETILMITLRELGFNISWNKIEGPSQSLTCLGIVINTCSLSLAMPVKKQREFYELLLSKQCTLHYKYIS